MNIFYYA